ncbi:MAG: sensor domain-containing protein [Candidatus Zixiibacteriota bacterium]|nr:MAG: sensor domain-containing protein [candidate division Zixibacteria bacterium]
MVSSIEEYLDQLEARLTGCDAATRRDALSDAEEHLRTALESESASETEVSEQEVLNRIIGKYGSPDEIAAAYRQIEARISPALAPRPRRPSQSVSSSFFGVITDPRAWGALLYMLFSLLTGIFYFTWAVYGVSLSLSLIIIIIGLPFTYLFLRSVRGIMLVEGRIVEALLGVRMPRRAVYEMRGKPWMQRLKLLLKNERTWTSLAYMVMQLPLGIIYFTIFIILVAFSLIFLAAPVAYLLDLPWGYIGRYRIYPSANLVPFLVIGGCFLFIGSMHLAKMIGQLHARLARAMLIGS